MNCSDYAVWIALKLEGSLRADRLDALEDHLAQCARCRAELSLQRKIHEALKQEVPSGLPVDFTDRVSGRALALASRRRKVSGLLDLIPVFALTATAVLLFAFRMPVADSLSSSMHTLGDLLQAGGGLIGDWMLAVFSRLPELPAGQAASIERFLTPAVALMAAGAVACIAVFWSFSRVRAYLSG